MDSSEIDGLRYIEDLGHTANIGTFQRKKKSKWRKVPAVIGRLFIIGIIGYLICVYSNNSFISKWRTIYIETAMSTMTHQWLATAFIPPDVVNAVMVDVEESQESQRELESAWERQVEINTEQVSDQEEIIEGIVKTDEELFFEKYWEIDTEDFRNFLQEHPEYLENGYDHINIEDLDKQFGLTSIYGDTLLSIDAPNNLLLFDLRTTDYVGKLAIVKNPAQVDLDQCEDLGNIGDPIWEFGERNDALVAINASRFKDDGGVGMGGIVCGSLVIDGVDYGRPHKGTWKFFGMKYDNLFYVTNYKNADVSEYRWAVECYPALVVNGENVIEGTFGMGIQPRTTIGQTRTGDFMFLEIDGRQVGYAIGASISECGDIMVRYGCYQGADLDGGSSSVMWYKGGLITKSCSATRTGRYTPDAIIIRRADDPKVLAQMGQTAEETTEESEATESVEGTETTESVEGTATTEVQQ